MTDRHALADDRWQLPEPRPWLWAPGRWRMELRGDELADLSYRTVTLLRSVRVVVRDRNWNTIPAEIVAQEARTDGLTLRLRFATGGADIDAVLALHCHADRIDMRVVFESHRDFETCRIGLVTLHPPTCAGHPLVITHPDGRSTATLFPLGVSPDQPAMNVRALRWVQGGIETTATFRGDVFEMEDQRNWSDASFKTYSTPLSVPFPTTFREGTVIEQSISIQSSGDPTPPAGRLFPSMARDGSKIAELTVGASTASTSEVAPGLSGLPRGRLVELDVRSATWKAALARAAGEGPGIRLDVRIIAGTPAEIETVLDAVQDHPVDRLGVFHPETHLTEPDLWRALKEGAFRRSLTSTLIAGARSHYTELNRGWETIPADARDITFSITPEMHATGRDQLIESIPMIRLLVDDAAAKAPGRRLHIGPITLRPRFNAVATEPLSPDDDSDLSRGYGADRVDGATDPRQFSPAVAAWTAAAFIAANNGAVASVTVFESSGPRGVTDSVGRPGPAARVIRELSALRGLPAVSAVDLPPHVHLLGALEGNGALRVVAANLSHTDVSLTVTVTGVPGIGEVELTIPALDWVGITRHA